MVRNRKPTARVKHSDGEILKAVALILEDMCRQSIRQLPLPTFQSIPNNSAVHLISIIHASNYFKFLVRLIKPVTLLLTFF